MVWPADQPEQCASDAACAGREQCCFERDGKSVGAVTIDKAQHELHRADRESCAEHYVSRKMHEAPEMPNYGKRGRGKQFVEGMVVAIEPMINMGTKNIKHLKDGWTIVTADKKPSAHFEHDVALVNGKPELLSTFAYIYQALGIESNEENEFRKNPLVL